MRIAFYAPLKSPLHTVPSGDRLLARAFQSALRRAGHEVTLAARLRSWDRGGDDARQQRIAHIGERLAMRLIRRWRDAPSLRPDLWFTYHVYHKAPDTIGPRVCDAIDIPYVVAEASVAQKQSEGSWRRGHAWAVAAIRRADAVLCINPADVPGVAAVRGNDVVEPLAPFIDIDAFVGAARATCSPPRTPVSLIVAAMMRRGNKLASFRLLAEALAYIEPAPWHLTIVGDGEAVNEVKDAYSRFAPQRVTFAGNVPHEAMAQMLERADLFLWPAVDEVIGMGLLEAQACGVPVIAGRGPGVSAVVADGVGGVLVAPGDARAFAAATEALVRDADRRRAMGVRARGYARANHDIAAAANAIDTVLQRAIARRRTADA